MGNAVKFTERGHVKFPFGKSRALAAERRYNLPALLNGLETLGVEYWDSFQVGVMIEEAEDFAKRLQALGERYGIQELADAARILLRQSAAFDFAGLKGIPDFLERLRVFCAE